MTQLPSLEGRIRAQEGMSTMFHARLEDIAQDMAVSFKQVVDYHIATERQLDARFNLIDARFDRVDARFSKVDARFDKIEGRLDKLETQMATKDDLAVLENKFEQRFTLLESKFEQRFTSLENKFDQMLQMVTALTKKIAE